MVFQHAVSLVFQPESVAVRFGNLPPEAIKAFIADRAGLFSGGSATRLSAEQARHQWPTIMARLEQQLQREQGDFLFGEPSIADFAMAHPLWFLKATPVTSPLGGCLSGGVGVAGAGVGVWSWRVQRDDVRGGAGGRAQCHAGRVAG